MLQAFVHRRISTFPGMAESTIILDGFPNIEGTGKTSQEMADYLLNEAGVACFSGTAFGASGEGYLRFSDANSVENINVALDKIMNAVS